MTETCGLCVADISLTCSLPPLFALWIDEGMRMTNLVYFFSSMGLRKKGPSMRCKQKCIQKVSTSMAY